MRRIEMSRIGQRAVIIAQVLVLTGFVLGLMFLRNTTGGTLFLFATVAPLLNLLAVAMVTASLWMAYRRRTIRRFGEVAVPREDRTDTRHVLVLASPAGETARGRSSLSGEEFRREQGAA